MILSKNQCGEREGERARGWGGGGGGVGVLGGAVNQSYIV
jgi:hypothetical protein